jgi:hypothetical protein
MLQAHVKITGTDALLLNNPQTVDRFNPYAQRMSRINKKGTRRTDDDYMEMRDIEIEAKIYWDDALGIYVPTTWLTAAIAANSFSTIKLSKAGVRGSVFAVEKKAKLTYQGMGNVKTPVDIIKNGDFHKKLTLVQAKARVIKMAPIFHNWSFETMLEFDDKTIDPSSLTHVVKHAARYGGFGDFRPTFGRATAEVSTDV